jgi:glutathione synthase
MNYLTSTYLLEMISNQCLIVNNPTAVRNAPEKLSVCYFNSLTPPSIITRDLAEIIAFRKEYKKIIIKPLYSHGGNNVFVIEENDKNFVTFVELFQNLYNHQFVIQAYIPNVEQGDKRILLANGKIVGGYLRTPQVGQIRANMLVGGTSSAIELTKRDYEICEAVGPSLRQNGLIIAGIDIIGDYITEINVTSPTGLASLKYLYNIDGAAVIWDEITKLMT